MEEHILTWSSSINRAHTCHTLIDWFGKKQSYEKRVVTKCLIIKEICFYRYKTYACDSYLYSSVILHNSLIAPMAIMTPWTSIAKQIRCISTGSVKINQNKDKSKLNCVHMSWNILHLVSGWVSGWYFKKFYKLLNLRALKMATLFKNCIFWCMDEIFFVEIYRYPMKFHTKYLTLTLKNVYYFCRWIFKSC